MRITLNDLRTSRCPVTLNVDPNSDRFTSYVNEACQRIFFSGENFFDLTQRFVMCVYNGCLTFPRRVAAIESLFSCNTPITIRNQWFENLEGVGLQTPQRRCNSDSEQNCNNGFWWNNQWCNWGNGYDRGTACTFSDIRNTNKKIRVYADIAEDDDAQILLQGYNDSGQWIRSEVDGEWIDGEYVDISTTPTNSTNFFTNLVAVQKPVTNGNVRLYEYNTDTTAQRALAVYEPTETNPVYRRMLVPGLENAQCCDENCSDDDSDECRRARITCIARLEYTPVSAGTDWVIPGNIPALKDMMQAVRHYEMNNEAEAIVCEQRAMHQLRTQLRHYLGHAVVQPIRRQPSAIANAGPGLNII